MRCAWPRRAAPPRIACLRALRPTCALSRAPARRATGGWSAANNGNGLRLRRRRAQRSRSPPRVTGHGGGPLASRVRGRCEPLVSTLLFACCVHAFSALSMEEPQTVATCSSLRRITSVACSTSPNHSPAFCSSEAARGPQNCGPPWHKRSIGAKGQRFSSLRGVTASLPFCI